MHVAGRTTDFRRSLPDISHHEMTPSRQDSCNLTAFKRSSESPVQAQTQSEVSPNWLRRIVDFLQTVAGDIDCDSTSTLARKLSTVPARCPRPVTAADSIVLRGLLALLYIRLLRRDPSQWRHHNSDVSKLLRYGLDSDGALESFADSARSLLCSTEEIEGRPLHQRAIHWLQLHVDSRRPVTAMAVDLGVEPHALSRRFKAHTGRSINQFQDGLRIDRALHLLRLTDTKIEAVALLAGFSNRGTFFRKVQRFTGSTPSEIRSACRDLS